MSELSYPKHQHPHGVENTQPNENRIWVCEECLHIFSDSELRKDKETTWGHICMTSPRCKSQRCESHLEPFEPELGLGHVNLFQYIGVIGDWWGRLASNDSDEVKGGIKSEQ